MRSRHKREFHIPKGSKAIEDNDSDAVVYIHTNQTGRPYGMAFHGRAQKPDWYHWFTSIEKREQKIQAFFKSRRSHLKHRRQEVEARKIPHDFKVGDILCSTWGYDQTNVDFYQVVRIVSTQTIEVRQIKSDLKQGSHFMIGTATPLMDHFVGETFQRRPDQGYVRLTSFSGARRWDGKPVEWTAYH